MRQQTYFRVQPGDRNPADLLDHTNQISRAWHDFEGDTTERTRTGVSVCDSRETLAAYLATVGQGIPYGEGGWILIELTGTLSADQPLDAEHGEYLIHPTAIVNAAPIDDEFYETIGAAYDAANGGH